MHIYPRFLGKLVERRGRKATGLREMKRRRGLGRGFGKWDPKTAGLPGS
jgi:hypothetical protein